MKPIRTTKAWDRWLWIRAQAHCMWCRPPFRYDPSSRCTRWWLHL